jgi:hypothetical protein
MTHKTEDQLLAYALEVTASDEERDDITAHLEACSECRERLESLEKDIELIGAVRPRRQALSMPQSSPRQTVGLAILRAAALIVVGFLVGLGTSSWADREPVFLSPTYLVLSPPTDSLPSHTVSDATDIPVEYYEQILESKE